MLGVPCALLLGASYLRYTKTWCQVSHMQFYLVPGILQTPEPDARGPICTFTWRKVRLRAVLDCAESNFREILCKNELFRKNILACLSEISRQTPSPWDCRAEIVSVPRNSLDICLLCPETASH